MRVCLCSTWLDIADTRQCQQQLDDSLTLARRSHYQSLELGGVDMQAIV